MEVRKHRLFTRTALILTLTVLFQSLRLFIPLPPLFSTFLIGTLVNACLLIAVETAGLGAAIIIAVATPAVAWFQQLLPLPVFIFPVAFANITYVTIGFILLRKQRWLGLVAAASIKTLVLYASISWLLDFVTIPPKVATGILFVMSWPQWMTAIFGGVLAFYILKRIKTII